MQLYGFYGILATPIYGSDRSGTIYGRILSYTRSATNSDLGASRLGVSCVSRGRLAQHVGGQTTAVLSLMFREAQASLSTWDGLPINRKSRLPIDPVAIAQKNSVISASPMPLRRWIHVCRGCAEKEERHRSRMHAQRPPWNRDTVLDF